MSKEWGSARQITEVRFHQGYQIKNVVKTSFIESDFKKLCIKRAFQYESGMVEFEFSDGHPNQTAGIALIHHTCFQKPKTTMNDDKQ